MLERYDLSEWPDYFADQEYLCLRCLTENEQSKIKFDVSSCGKCRKLRLDRIRLNRQILYDYFPIEDLNCVAFSLNSGADILKKMIADFSWEPIAFDEYKNLIKEWIKEILHRNFESLNNEDKRYLEKALSKGLTLKSIETMAEYYANSYNSLCDFGDENFKLIDYISVRNLFGYHSYDLKMSEDGLSVIIGTNGLGKTTIFRILKAILTQGKLMQGKTWEMLYEKLEYIWSVPFKSFVVGFRDGTTIELKQELNPQNEKQLLLGINDKNYISFIKNDELKKALNGIDDSLNIKEQELIFPAEIFSTNFVKEVDDIKQIFNKVGNLFPKLRSLKERFLFIETKRIELDELCQNLKELERNDVNNKKTAELADSFTKLYYEKDPSRKILEFDNKNNLVVRTSTDKLISVNCLSSGEKGALQILYDVIFNSGKNAIILIDEPEISLHIVWQQQLSEIISKIVDERPGSQVIIATHSPFMASANENSIVEAELV